MLIDLITSDMLSDRVISSQIVGEACHLSETLRERQSILKTPNIHITKSKMVCGKCPPYGMVDVIHPFLNSSNLLPLG
jgi:hypothetical protein